MMVKLLVKYIFKKYREQCVTSLENAVGQDYGPEKISYMNYIPLTLKI